MNDLRNPATMFSYIRHTLKILLTNLVYKKLDSNVPPSKGTYLCPGATDAPGGNDLLGLERKKR